MSRRSKCKDYLRNLPPDLDICPLFMCRMLTDISIMSCFVHVRYVVSLPTIHYTAVAILGCVDVVSLSYMQDVSGNALDDISALGALPHLLTIKADHNRITNIKLQEVNCLMSTEFPPSSV